MSDIVNGDENQGTASDNSVVVGPGEILRNARLACPKSIDEIADRLHLSRNVIIALENDEYHSLPGSTFIRGYLRAYAREVQLSPDEIVSIYDAQGLEEPEFAIISTPAMKNNPRQYDKLARWVSYLILLGMIVLVFIWWRTHGANDGDTVVSAEEDTQQDLGADSNSAGVAPDLSTVGTEVGEANIANTAPANTTAVANTSNTANNNTTNTNSTAQQQTGAVVNQSTGTAKPNVNNNPALVTNKDNKEVVTSTSNSSASNTNTGAAANTQTASSATMNAANLNPTISSSSNTTTQANVVNQANIASHANVVNHANVATQANDTNQAVSNTTVVNKNVTKNNTKTHVAKTAVANSDTPNITVKTVPNNTVSTHTAVNNVANNTNENTATTNTKTTKHAKKHKNYQVFAVQPFSSSGTGNSEQQVINSLEKNKKHHKAQVKTIVAKPVDEPQQSAKGKTPNPNDENYEVFFRKISLFSFGSKSDKS